MNPAPRREGGRPSPWTELGAAAFRIHMLLYPKGFREAFGQEMQEVFLLRFEETRSRHPGGLPKGLALVSLLGRTGKDAIWAAIQERIHGSTPPTPGNQSPGHPTAPQRGPRMSFSTRIDPLLQDIRFGFRSLRKRPLFTLITVLTLGLGIGSATSVFSVVDAILLRPLPYSDPGTLVSVWEAQRNLQDTEEGEIAWNEFPFTWDDYLALREGTTLMDVGVFVGWGEMPLTGAGNPEQLSVGYASANLFDILGVHPYLGRAFLPGEDGSVPGQASQLALLSHELWQRSFGGDRSVLGSAITLNEIPFTVVGILPPGFRLQSEIVTVVGGGTDLGLRDLWVPIGQGGMGLRNEGNAFEVLGRLSTTITPAQARAEVDAILAEARPSAELQARVSPRKEVVTRGFAMPLIVMLSGTGLLLLIACANVATLLICEASGRRHEVATRAALGAGMGRLSRQLLTESVLLGLFGSVVGIALSFFGTKVLLSLAPPMPRLEEVEMSTRVLGFAVGAGLITGILFGLAPLALLTRISVGEALVRRVRGSSEGGSWLQRGTVTLQFALTVVLLVVGGLFARSLVNIRAVDPGFEPENLATLRISVPQGRYATQAEASRYFQMVVDEIEAVPGVESVAGSYGLPFPGGSPRNVLQLGGPDSEVRVGARRRTILPEYHETMGIPLIEGRLLSRSDEEDQQLAMVVSQSLANEYWPDQSPVGTTVGFWDGSWTIVGIVGDVRHTELTSEGEPTFYVPFAQVPRRNLNLVVRTAGDPAAAIPLIREATWRIDPDMPLTEVNTLRALVEESTADSRYRTFLILVLGSMASVLAAVGIFGVTARTVARRTRELGIRMSLGAQAGTLIADTLRNSLFLATAGTLVGLLAAFVASRLLSHFLFGVEAADPLTYGAVASALLLVSTVAALLPALRVGRLQPMDVLREE